MRLAITAQGADLDAPVDLQFGRCPHFVVVNTEETEQGQPGTSILEKEQ